MKESTLTEKLSAWLDKHQYIWLLVGFVIVSFVVSVNPFPADYRFVSGDIAEPSGVAARFTELVADTDGRGLLWYGLFFLFDVVGLSDGAILSVHLFFFLVGSFLSFSWFLRKLIPDTSGAVGMLFSLVYALNTLTLSFFVSGWMFSPALVLYPFLPALVASFLLCLRAPAVRTGGIFLILLFFASAACTHAETVVALYLFLILLTVAAFAFGWVRLRRETFGLLGLLAVFSLALLAYALSSSLTMIRHGEASTLSEAHLGLEWYLRNDGASVIETLRLLSHDFLSHFPYWFPHEALQGIAPLFLILTTVPLLGVVYALLLKKPDEDRKRLFFVAFSLLLVFIVLVAKARPPFVGISGAVYSLPGMGSLRGAERLSLFVPFLTLFVIVSSRVVHRFRVALYPILLLVLLTPIPFFMGGIHTKWSPLFEDDYAPNRYDLAETSSLVRVPEAYHEAAETLRDADPAATVARLPFSAREERPGWERIPDWNHFGADILPEYFSNTLVSANRPYEGGFLFAGALANSNEDPVWILPFLRSAGIRYLLLDQAAPRGAVQSVAGKLDHLLEIGAVETAWESDMLTLYRLTGAVLPRVLIAEEDIPVSGRPASDRTLVGVVSALEYREPEIEKAGKGCILRVGPEDSGRLLVLTRPFSPHYGAVLIGSSGEETGLRHVHAFGFQNGWELPEIDGEATVRIVYYPERFVEAGRIISLLALACVIIIVSANTLYERRKH